MLLWAPALAFVPTTTVSPVSFTTRQQYHYYAATKQSPTRLNLSSSLSVAAATVDPTLFLSDLLGGLINTPAILAVPILAALGVAGLIAWFIIAYANPTEEE